MSKKVIKSFEKDFAPMLFYFDLIPSKIFSPPVMPLPLRIDKLFSGDKTAFIHPNFDKLKTQLNNLDLKFNYFHYIETGLKNFIEYAKSKVKNLTLRDYSHYLKKESVRKWFKTSTNIKFYNPDLQKDLTFMISEFIDLFSRYIHKNIEKNTSTIRELLVDYCDKIINHFRRKIESNEITIIVEQQEKKVKLSREKRSKFYPDIIEHDVVLLENYKVKKMRFVPYLIYDDILDCFSYNKKLLTEGKESFYNLELWKTNQIINKRSNITKNSLDDYDLRKFDISKVNIEKLI